MSAPAGAAAVAPPPRPHARLPAAATERARGGGEHVALYALRRVPFLALVAVVPAVWGWGLGWLDVGLAVGLLLLHPARHHRRLPPPLHARLVQGQPRPLQGRARRRGLAWRSRGRSSSGSPTTAGTTPSPTARATRTRPWRYGETVPGAGQGHVPRPHGLAVRRRADQPRSATRPTCSKDRDLQRIAAPSRCSSPPRCCCPACSAACWSLGWQGAAHRVLLGRARAGRAAAPRHLVDQLDLPHARRPAVHEPRPSRQLLVAGDPVDGRVLAQPAPRRPDLRPARRPARPDRHQRPRDLAVREARAGRPTSGGRAPTRLARPPGRRAGLRCDSATDAQVTTDGVSEPRSGTRRARRSRAAGADDRRGAARATARRRPRAVRREGLRGHRVEEIAARAEVSASRSSTSTSAARRGCTRSSSTGRSSCCSTSITASLGTAGRPRELLEQAALVLLDYIEEDTDGFRILVRDSPVAQATGTFAEPHQRRRQPGRAHARPTSSGPRLRPEGGAAVRQTLVGMVALAGQWWLDNRKPKKHEVAAHLVNLAWNGLSGLERKPTLTSRPRTASSTGRPSGRGRPHRRGLAAGATRSRRRPAGGAVAGHPARPAPRPRPGRRVRRARAGAVGVRRPGRAAPRRGALQLSPGQLTAETLVTSGTMTNRIDRLEQRASCARRPDPSDGRGVLVGLTENGRSSVDTAPGGPARPGAGAAVVAGRRRTPPRSRRPCAAWSPRSTTRAEHANLVSRRGPRPRATPSSSLARSSCERRAARRPATSTASWSVAFSASCACSFSSWARRAAPAAARPAPSPCAPSAARLPGPAGRSRPPPRARRRPRTGRHRGPPQRQVLLDAAGQVTEPPSPSRAT